MDFALGRPGWLALLLPLSLPLCALADETPDEAGDSPLESQGETVTVYGRALSLYRADETSSATRTPTALEDIPQSVQVLPQTLIEDQGARQITDLYRSISGVSQYSYSGVTFRGFRQDQILYDGVRGDPFNGFAIPQLFNIEQVEVLKGPSSALMGSGEPGGTINYRTKQPSHETHREVSLTGGNQDYAGGSLALSGPVNDEDSQRYRIGLYQDHENPSRNNTDVRNRILDFGYAWDLSSATTATVQFTDVLQHYGGARLRGVPTDAKGNFLADIDWNANESSDYQDLAAQVYQLRLDHVFNDWLLGDLTLRYYQNTETQKYHEPSGLSDADGDGVVDWSAREYRDQVRHNKAGSLTGNLTAQLGPHTLLLGSDFYRLDEDYTYYRARAKDGVEGLSLTDPQYGTTDPSTYGLHLTKQTWSRSDRYGLYVQDQWAITPAWNLLGGLRLDGFSDEVQDRINDSRDHYSGQGMSYRLGSTYRITPQLHPYAVVATGFVPQDAADQATSNGGPFDPEESLMYETGLRSYWFDNALSLNLALYQITKRNLLQTDPADDDSMIALGQVRSRGVELDALADLTDNWTANLSYAYNRVKIIEGSEAVADGEDGEFANAPHHQLGLWTRYDIRPLNSAISFGADHVSRQYDQSGQIVKAYTVFDAAWQTRWQQWLFQLNAKNLLDKEYAVSGFLARTGEFPGEGRRVYLKASYQF